VNSNYNYYYYTTAIVILVVSEAVIRLPDRSKYGCGLVTDDAHV